MIADLSGTAHILHPFEAYFNLVMEPLDPAYLPPCNSACAPLDSASGVKGWVRPFEARRFTRRTGYAGTVLDISAA